METGGRATSALTLSFPRVFRVFFNVQERGYSDLAFDWGAGPGSGLGLAFEFNLNFDAGFFFGINYHRTEFYHPESNGFIKAHGGETKVETKESEATEFVVELPKKIFDEKESANIHFCNSYRQCLFCPGSAFN